MGSVLVVQPEIDMLGVNNELQGSRSTSNTPTSTSAPPPSTRHHNDAPAYNSHGPHSSAIHPAPMPTSNYTNYTYPSDQPSYSNSQTPQYSGQHASHAMMAVPAYAQASPESPRLQPTFRSMQSLGSAATSPSRIRVQSLSHIQSLASEEFLAQAHPSHAAHGAQQRQFEISSMPVTDIIEMVAGLLTKITDTNDRNHEHNRRHIPPPEGTSNLSTQDTSVLAFHGKNVPSITILSYLTRIHKYCPTTYEVFLSLLVYFDRMTDLVNRGKLDHFQRYNTASSSHSRASSEALVETTGRHPNNPSIATPPPSAGMTAQDPTGPNKTISPAIYPQGEEDSLSHFFVVDSFNIHRLVIAGVTCASKFFSDVFYTNSRYAKV